MTVRRRGGARGTGLGSLARRAARTPRGAIGLVLLGSVVAVALIGPLVAPHPYTSFVTYPFSPPGKGHLFGGDVLGRDVLSRVLCGGAKLLAMAAGATLIGVGAGTAIGIYAAYAQGMVDGALMRAVDVLLAFPQLVFALLLVSILGPSVWLLVLAVAIAQLPQVARVVRAAALDVSERDYVKAVELWKVPRRLVIKNEILPNVTSIVMVELGLRMTWSIILLAGLSFIGFGLQPPDPNWGSLINENLVGLDANPWGVLVPVALLALLTVGLNMYTDAIARVSLGVDRGTEIMSAPLTVGSAEQA